jgi:hypothetical protein
MNPFKRKLEKDIAGRRHLIKSSENLIGHWERELHNPLSTPLPAQGVDYAYGTPDLGRLKATGATFIGRYLGGNPDKDLTTDEALRLSHAGFNLITVFESAADRALLSHPAGEEDAVAAQLQLGRIGNPHAPVYFAVDFEATPEQIPNIRGYFNGAVAQLGRDRVGVYGSYTVVHELMSLDNIKYGWQTLAWSHGQWSPHAQVRQTMIEQPVAGVTCDIDRALAADFGQWRRT